MFCAESVESSNAAKGMKQKVAVKQSGTYI